MTTTTPEAVDADAPFDLQPRADIILRSSDNVDFYAVRLLLTVDPHSFFSNILTDGQSDVTKNGLPVIGSLEEDSPTLRQLLLCCYPLTMTGGIKLSFQTIDQVLALVQMASKYCMDSVFDAMQPAMLESPAVMDKTPVLQLYALGTQYAWEAVSRKAARRYLDIPSTHLFESSATSTLKNINGSDLLRLQQYHLRCRLGVQRVLTARTKAPRPYTQDSLGVRDLTWLAQDRLWLPGQGHYNENLVMIATGSLHSKFRPIHKWAVDYLDAMEAALLECPSLSAAETKMETAIKKLGQEIQSCTVCRAYAGTDVRLFVRQVSGLVELTLSKVNGTFPFSYKSDKN